MPAPTPLRRLLPALLFGVAGLLVNALRFEIFFGVDFLFGSVLVMLAILHGGFASGALAALIASSITWVLWNHPWAMVIFVGEALSVGWLVRRRAWDLLMADAAYWVILGPPLVWGFYHHALHVEHQTAVLIILKQAINGIINTLLAYLLHLAWRAWRRPMGAPRPAFRSVVFATMVSLVTFPALLSLCLYIRQDLAQGQQALIRRSAELDRITRSALRAWIEDRHETIITLAGLVARPDLSRAHQQRAVEVIRSVTPAFKRVGVLDADANVVAYSPRVDDAGRSNLQKNFGDRPYIPDIKATLRPRVADLVLARIGPPEPIIPLVVPIVRKGRYDGYCIGVTDADQLQDYLRIIAGSAPPRLTLLDRNSKVVSSTRGDLARMSPFAAPHGDIRPLGEGVWHTVPRATPGRSTMQRWSDSFIVQEGLLSRDLPWKVVVESPLAPLIAGLTGVSILGLGTLLLLILATMALARALSRGFTVSIGQLEWATRTFPDLVRTGSGALPALPSSGIEEMHNLAARFRGMAEALQSSFHELNALKDTLEQRVATRTLELQTALDTIKTLHGIIPICASCKKIRDDKGYWNQLETYISEHTEADFSHGICPDCARRLYPEIRGRTGEGDGA